jgi:hypothetical protein
MLSTRSAQARTVASELPPELPDPVPGARGHMSASLGSESKLSSENTRGVHGSGELVAELAAELSADPPSGDGARICTAGTGGRACCTMSSSSVCAYSPGLSFLSTLDARAPRRRVVAQAEPAQARHRRVELAHGRGQPAPERVRAL